MKNDFAKFCLLGPFDPKNVHDRFFLVNFFSANVSVWVWARKLNFYTKDIHIIMFKRENVFFEDLLFRPFLDQKTCTVVFLFDQNLFGHNVSVWVRATKLNFCKRDIYMIMFRHEKLFFLRNSAF